MSDKIYFKIQTNNIQCFLAVFWYVERNKGSVYIIDENNELILNRIKNLIKIKVQRINIESDYKQVNVNIDHKSPTTTIDGFTAKLFFPKLINEEFKLKPENKISKVFFAGNLTKIRFLESLKLFFGIRDLKAIIKLLIFTLLFQKREFKIETSKIDFHFTNNGRNPDIKFLDKQYYRNLAKYKFIFCPQGIFEWTYRFYETTLVNSVPVIDFRTKAFGDFKYITSNSLNTINKSAIQRIVDHNFQLIQDGKVL